VSNGPVVVQKDTILLQLVKMRLNFSGGQVLETLALLLVRCVADNISDMTPSVPR
jgi:hypothetical protein